MTNLTPNPSWDDVLQMETDTRALAGPGGVMNAQAQALLNRTAKLAADVSTAQTTANGAVTAAATAQSGADASAKIADLANSSDATKGAAMVANATRRVSTIAELRALPAPTQKTTVFVEEHSTGRGPLGGGMFYWSAQNTSADDNGMFILPAGQATGTPGRWKRKTDDGEVNAMWFGAWADDNNAHEADDTAAILAAVAKGVGVYLPAGKWVFSPLTAPIVFPSPYQNEGNRTSGCLLSTGQYVRGDGDQTQLRWGPSRSTLNNGTQGFFKAANCQNVTLRDMYMRDAFCGLIIDPVSDGAVQNVTVLNCRFENNLIDVIGGRQLAIDPTSKYSKNVRVIGCHHLSPAGSHAILFTNTYNAQAIGNRFLNITQGYCVDASQGTRGAVIAHNVADVCQYFAKIESTDVSGANPTGYKSNSVAIVGNVARTISQTAVLLNTAADRVTVSGNVFTDFAVNGVVIDEPGGYAIPTFDGNVVVEGNVLQGSSGSTYGVRDAQSGGTRPHVLANNAISGVAHGYWVARKNSVINGGQVSASANGIVVDTSVAINGVFIGGGIVVDAPTPINLSGTGTVRKVSIGPAQLNPTNCAIYGADLAAAKLVKIEDVTIDTASTLTLPAIAVKNPQGCTFKDNTINIPAASLIGIQTYGATTDCDISGNVSTKAFTIASPNASTVSTPNITNATYIS